MFVVFTAGTKWTLLVLHVRGALIISQSQPYFFWWFIYFTYLISKHLNQHDHNRISFTFSGWFLLEKWSSNTFFFFYNNSSQKSLKKKRALSGMHIRDVSEFCPSLFSSSSSNPPSENESEILMAEKDPPFPLPPSHHTDTFKHSSPPFKALQLFFSLSLPSPPHPTFLHHKAHRLWMASWPLDQYRRERTRSQPKSSLRSLF